MLLENLIPNLPQLNMEIIVTALAIVCTFLIIYGLFLESEKRQDILYIIGFFGLFIYALFISSPVFVFTCLGMFVAATVELIEIMMGIHQQEKYDLKKIIRENKKIKK
ncbi:MAG TPA: hypothetical protein PK831_03595 [Candidatus Magasanikbacteria bacterium]|jgi:predicted membrane protein|nr:hypothetical protein [Candidatus Magasanikbacteria bacterium]HQF57552.1 hypothetical protein [Candidatus Magasanikbacteria bacterium]HQL53006.1 hypothetical protein [Candidatus Magasanikbacteria bacterium]